jgi:hypothetical protein
MSKSKAATYVILITIILFVHSCDAPRTNPLDPENDDNIYTYIEGTVKTVSVPNQPLGNARVIWDSGRTVVYSDADGYFVIENIEKNNGWLFFEKEGYSSDSTFISWDEAKRVVVSEFLNSVPKIDSLIFSTETINTYNNLQYYSLFVQAGISDEENDVDSVFISNDDLDIHESLEYNLSTRFYELRKAYEEIDELVGKEFSVMVKDTRGKIFTIAQTNLKRIIKQEVEFLTPSNRDTVNNPIVFNWRRFLPGFPFYYKLQIYTEEFPQQLVYEENFISSDSIRVTVDSGLPEGEYTWVIWAIDEFMNACRSKPASFIIQ